MYEYWYTCMTSSFIFHQESHVQTMPIPPVLPVTQQHHAAKPIAGNKCIASSSKRKGVASVWAAELLTAENFITVLIRKEMEVWEN